MLPYYSRNNRKQRIKNKLVRSKFKIWVPAEPFGYAVNLDPYQGGKCGNTITASNKTWGLEETVVL